jgi:hypothetical protein
VRTGQDECVDGTDLGPGPFAEHRVIATALRNSHIGTQRRTFRKPRLEFGVECPSAHLCRDIRSVIDGHVLPPRLAYHL